MRGTPSARKGRHSRRLVAISITALVLAAACSSDPSDPEAAEQRNRIEQDSSIPTPDTDGTMLDALEGEPAVAGEAGPEVAAGTEAAGATAGGKTSTAGGKTSATGGKTSATVSNRQRGGAASPATPSSTQGTARAASPVPAANAERPAQAGGSGSTESGGKENYASDTGVTKDRIKVGLINLASNARALGPLISGSSERVADAAIKYVNRTGGINGRQLEMVVCDDGGDITRARACYEKLKKDVFALIPGETFVTDVIHDRMIKDKMPWISWGWFSSEYENPWMFPAHANGFREANAMARWVAENIKPKRVGIMYLNVSEDIKATEEATRVFKKYGIDVVKTIAQEFDSPDESQHVLAMRAANPDVVLGFSWPTPIAKFFHDASAQRWAPEKGYFFNHLAADPGYLPILSEYAKDRTYTIASWLVQNEDTPELKLYRDEVTRAYGKEYLDFKFKYAMGHHLSQSAWVGVRVLAEALKTLGADVTRDGLKRVLEANAWDSGMGVTLRWPEGNHNAEPYSFAREFMYKYVTGDDGGYDIKRVMPDAIYDPKF